MQKRNELIVQLIYRRIKGYNLDPAQEIMLSEWLKVDSNLRTFQNLNDPEWVAQAKEKYYAPGKEKGLEQLREALIADRPIEKKEGRWLFWLLFVAIGAIVTYLLF